MIKANFNAYSNYVTDSLYQWDLNQDLVIRGLNLLVAPEIHFANANMDRAIVKQSALNNGVVTVRIPNSLLQSALIIKAYVGIYEGDTFKVVETVEIPVIAKERPADYAIEDSDEEIYSFNRLENEIANMVTAKEFNATVASLENADASNKTDVENQIANTKTVLENQIANIIAHNNDTDGNTELLDIRAGADGITYDSAGEAVRGQFNKKVSFDIVKDISEIQMKN